MSFARSTKGTGLALSGAILLAFPPDAHAYIEPGSTAVLLNIIVAAIVGGLVVLRTHISILFKNLVSVFKKGDKPRD